MTLLYLVRHGETEMNSKGVYYGWTDCALSQRGQRQAADLARDLANVSFDAVLASPLLRARQTAEMMRPEADLVLDQRLKELNFGIWEGRHYLEIAEEYPEQWQNWTADWQHAAPPGGESFSQLYQRVDSCLQDILRDYPDQTLLLVAHHGSLRIILSRLLGLNRESYWNFTFAQGKHSLVEIQDGHCVVKNINS